MRLRADLSVVLVSFLVACGSSTGPARIDPEADGGAPDGGGRPPGGDPRVIDGGLDRDSGAVRGVVDGGLPVDGGLAPDAGAECGALGVARCLAAGCVPVFDREGCPFCEAPSDPCEPGAGFAFYVCRSYRDTCEAAFCGLAPPWVCAGSEPDCARATVVSETSCDEAGCVPAYPSGDGDPDPGAASCAPIRTETCVATCERVPPPCPTGTVPEGDGRCFTERCIPRFVCE